MNKDVEDFYESPCNRNCKLKERWLVDAGDLGQQLSLSTLLICLGCVHFERRNHFIPDIKEE